MWSVLGLRSSHTSSAKFFSSQSTLLAVSQARTLLQLHAVLYETDQVVQVLLPLEQVEALVEHIVPWELPFPHPLQQSARWNHQTQTNWGSYSSAVADAHHILFPGYCCSMNSHPLCILWHLCLLGRGQIVNRSLKIAPTTLWVLVGDTLPKSGSENSLSSCLFWASDDQNLGNSCDLLSLSADSHHLGSTLLGYDLGSWRASHHPSRTHNPHSVGLMPLAKQVPYPKLRHVLPNQMELYSGKSIGNRDPGNSAGNSCVQLDKW